MPRGRYRKTYNITDEQFIEAWKSATPVEKLSEELGISIKALRYTWRQLRGKGLIPATPRNVIKKDGTTKQPAGPKPEPLIGSTEYNSMYGSDGRPMTDEDQRDIVALMAAHGHPRYDHYAMCGTFAQQRKYGMPLCEAYYQGLLFIDGTIP